MTVMTSDFQSSGGSREEEDVDRPHHRHRGRLSVWHRRHRCRRPLLCLPLLQTEAQYRYSVTLKVQVTPTVTHMTDSVTLKVQVTPTVTHMTDSVTLKVQVTPTVTHMTDSVTNTLTVSMSSAR